MPVNSAQFRRTVVLFNNQKFLKCNMNHPFLSDTTMRQSHITTFRTCSSLVLLHLILFLRSIFALRKTFLPRQFRIQILKLAFAIRLSFICIFCGIDLSGDIEKNPGTWPSSSQNRWICHWNLSNITAHTYAKVSSLKTSQFINLKFDIWQICYVHLSETYLDPSVPLHDLNLEIKGYELVQSGHLSQHKRDGVCIYFRNSLLLKILNIRYLQESISFELQVGSKIWKFVSFYQSPSQNKWWLWKIYR